MLNSLKGKFLFMQDGISASFRSFKINSEKQENSPESSVNFNAGSEILLKNEMEWNEMTSLFETNARKAVIVDGKINDIHNHLNEQLHCLQEINGFASNMTKFLRKVDSVTEELSSLRIVVERVEDFILVFEDLVENRERQSHEMSKEDEYSQYLERKTQELNVVKKKLEDQYAQKVFLKEKEIQVTLRERQKLFDMAFQQDMQLYKESGIIPNIRSFEAVSNVQLEDVVIDDDLNELNELLND